MVVAGVVSSMRLASAEICPQVRGTLVAHKASDAIATLQARRLFLSGAMLEVEVLSVVVVGREVGRVASTRPTPDFRCVR
jgi:hypothetical protein